LSIILLIGAALMMKSFARLRTVDPGFQPNHVLTAKIPLPPVRYDTELKRARFFDEVVRRVDALAGVDSSAAAMSLPTTRWIRTNITKVEGRAAEDERKPLLAIIQSVTPGYFKTLGIPLRRGREFTAHDNQPGSPPAMIINESLVRRLWPDYPRGVNPVGQHISEGYDKTIGWFEIAGIAANVHEGGLASEAPPEFYVPCFIHPPQTAYLAVRTKSDPLSFITAVRRQVLAVDSNQPITDVKTMNAVLDATLGQRRLTMWLLGSFAGVALLLAVIGIYGVIAYSVAQRTQEVGIRRALGAEQGDILRMVMAQALRLSLAGVAIGVCGAFVLTRVMKSLLFHVTAGDPMTFLSVAASFVAVALVASYVPARRAARLDPVSALRVG
jgi:predicted permease